MTTSVKNAPEKKSTNVRLKVPACLPPTFQVMSRLAPGLTSRIAADLFTRPHHVKPRTPAERQWLATGTPFKLKLRGYELAAWSWGDGPTILLQHGWAGRGSNLGAFVRPLVKSGLSVIAYDAPGHGDSPGRNTTGFEMADIIAQITRRNLDLRGIVAHSIGCVATALAMRGGIQVARAVFINPPGEMASYAEGFANTLGFSPEVMQRMLSRFEMGRSDKFSEFSGIKLADGQRAPLLVLSDLDDRQIDWSEGKAIANAWPGALFETTEGLGHARILADPAVVERVSDFLR